MSALIDVGGVRKRFGEHEVLAGIDLVVPEGETIALIGPSGGGKSTLLRCINGLANFDQGRIQVGACTLHPTRDPRESRAAARDARKLVGMVFQDFQLFPHMTALENVAEAPIHVRGLPRREAHERARALLARVGLEARADALPRELSGGQKQRVAIARALAMEPKALLCDEITSALDPELKGEVLSVIEKLRAEGMTLVLVTHEIGFARRAADRAAVLADGAIVESGPARELIDRPQTERTRRFLERVMA
ncbi:MAG: amino acid ABC transporter ATP-binding protein [Deltaproteobacteria bacterium]|nr:amino acid ABC transporter ATP-binding protein [Deltaproteobacteria bacterium]